MTINEGLQARPLKTDETQQPATEREAMAAALNQERTRMAAILGSVSDAIIVVDSNGEPVLTNDAFRRLFGDALPPPDDSSEPKLPGIGPQLLAARGETFTQHFTLTGPGGNQQWFEAHGQPVRADDPSAGGVVVIRDVSDRNLRQRLEQFVALAGHELRTPLTALTGSLQLLERAMAGHPDADDRLQRYVSIGLQQARLLAELIEELADVVRLQAGELPIARGPVDLVELVRTSVDLVRPMAGDQPIEVHLPPSPLLVDGDRRRLQQVLLNVLANAIQHGSSPDGVIVRLASDAADAVVLDVRDHGPGIPADERDRVFECFYQIRRFGGHGLGVGLCIVKAIVAAHDGTVRVEAPEGRGARFVIRLPRLATPTL